MLTYFDLLILFIGYSSVELPELTRSNSNNDESQSSSSSSENERTAAALLQQIKDIVNAKNHLEDNNGHSNFTSSPFQRTVNWTFENMKMLVGSDLPIFGDEKHPAVSLRLRYVLKRLTNIHNRKYDETNKKVSHTSPTVRNFFQTLKN